MRFLTDRKRAEGIGAGHSGTEHHWTMQVSSVGLAILVPVWLYIFGTTLGAPRAEVLATFGRPLPAIVTALLLVVGMRHFAMGTTTLLQDYVHGTRLQAAIIAVVCLSTAIAATGLYALARIAL